MEKFKSLKELVDAAEADATAFYEKATKQPAPACVTPCKA